MNPMNPRDQECLGFYLYGAGFFSRDDNTLGVVTGQKSPPHFCLSCSAREACEDRHEERTRELMPAQVEEFERRMQEGLRRGYGATAVAAFLSQRGLDPFATMAVDNFNRGHGDRGRQAGTLVRPKPGAGDES